MKHDWVYIQKKKKKKKNILLPILGPQGAT